MNKILVTGGAGFIGSHFVELAVARGANVTVLDALTYAGHRENLETIPKAPGEWLLREGDIRSMEAVAAVFRELGPFDSVVHFAAESHVDRSITGPMAFVETNVLGTAHLLHCALQSWRLMKGAEKYRFRFLHVSTDEVFGALGPEGFFSESTPYAPNSPYSASKAGADHLVRAWHETYGLPTLNTHCTNNYGPRQMPEKLIPRMIQCGVTGADLPVYGKGLNVRDWIHVTDHVRGILLALEKGTPGGSYCFGGRTERRNIDLVHEVCERLDVLRPKKEGRYADQIRSVDDRLGHDFRYAMDDSHARRELGFANGISFSEGLESTIRWYLENEAWCRAVMENTR